MPRTKGAKNNMNRWDDYLNETHQTSLGGVKHLITSHMTWVGLLAEIGLSNDMSNKKFFKDRAREVHWHFDSDKKTWARIRPKRISNG